MKEYQKPELFIKNLTQDTDVAAGAETNISAVQNGDWLEWDE